MTVPPVCPAELSAVTVRDRELCAVYLRGGLAAKLACGFEQEEDPAHGG